MEVYVTTDKNGWLILRTEGYRDIGTPFNISRRSRDMFQCDTWGGGGKDEEKWRKGHVEVAQDVPKKLTKI
jgi:hypothetical protein